MTLEDDVFRERTNGAHKKMSGIMLPSFLCAKCKQPKAAKGRKQVVRGTGRYGYYCADCAATVSEQANP